MDSGLTAYREALDALFARTGATSKFGLQRTLDFLELLGNPHDRLKTFHVAGTNGKGSVVATLYALLRSKGLRTGRYTSPHLIDFRERVVVNDEMIDESYVVDFLARWSPRAHEMGATFFEITTAMAFDYFVKQKVDVAVIETGLGGRLDSTNVIHPVASGVTSISIDHTEFLGNTEAEISREKAGIFKPGVPSVIGKMSTDARIAIYQTAAAAGVAAVIDATRLFKTHDVHVRRTGTWFTIEQGTESMQMRTGLIGGAQADNAAVALAMLRAAGSPWSVTLGEASAVLPSVRLPGRFQILGKYVLDVAHNPDGMRSLTSTLSNLDVERPIVAVLGILADKDWRQMMKILSRSVDEIVLVAPPTAPRARAWSVEEAYEFAVSERINARIERDFAQAVTAAAENAATAVITGSFHTVGDALEVLGEKAI
ncbi:MAG TPA: folylpolyglutamate synthase/dihydrofolate synthase family protein [Gemmatimonadaceae bacterium]|nr:folylpolyglutamate synthase/dihydrofolate synthase family protein [Gemmatimonadaceae bacterium]